MMHMAIAARGGRAVTADRVLACKDGFRQLRYGSRPPSCFLSSSSASSSSHSSFPAFPPSNSFSSLAGQPPPSSSPLPATLTPPPPVMSSVAQQHSSGFNPQQHATQTKHVPVDNDTSNLTSPNPTHAMTEPSLFNLFKSRAPAETVTSTSTAAAPSPSSLAAAGAGSATSTIDHTMGRSRYEGVVRTLPKLPFVPPPELNPDLTNWPRFRPDASSTLLAYPRTNPDHIHDFHGLYNPPKKSTLWNFTSSVVISSVALVGKTFMTFGSYTGVYNVKPFTQLLFDPNRTRPILTVTNHTSTADDPILWGTLPFKCFKEPSKHCRYALGAQEICYPNGPVGQFFKFGQVIPIVRGNGIYQPAVDKAIELLKEGKWVHVFPEGKVNQTSNPIRLKWGIGRILTESAGIPVEEGGLAEPPIVVPIYHLGMDDILRENPDGTSPIWPKMGLPLTIIFGEPIEFESLLQKVKEGEVDEITARVMITDRVFEAMEELRVVALDLHRQHAQKSIEDQEKNGRWSWIQKPISWGWWRSPTVQTHPSHPDLKVKL